MSPHEYLCVPANTFLLALKKSHCPVSIFFALKSLFATFQTFSSPLQISSLPVNYYDFPIGLCLLVLPECHDYIIDCLMISLASASPAEKGIGI